MQVPTDDPNKKDHIVEINFRRFELRTSPNIRYAQQIKIPQRFYVSRTATVKELHLRICEEIYSSSAKNTGYELLGYSRLWVFE